MVFNRKALNTAQQGITLYSTRRPMSTVKYHLVSELARPGEQFEVAGDVEPIVEPSERQGFVRVTYMKPVKSLPIVEDDDVRYVE